MKGLLYAHLDMVKNVYMTDLSTYMLNRQREALKEWGNLIQFIKADMLKIHYVVKNIDIIILNEVGRKSNLI